MLLENQIDVQDLDHLGIIAGIVGEGECGTSSKSDDIELHGILDIPPIFVQ